jgi:hypothetical protein
VIAPAPPCTPAAAKAATAAIVRARGYQGVDRVICADLTGDGKPELAVTFFSGGTAGDTGWAVLAGGSGTWRVVLRQLDGYKVGLHVRHADLVESQPVYRKNDPNCCPTGGFDHRRFHWNGRKFALARVWHDRSYRPRA